ARACDEFSEFQCADSGRCIPIEQRCNRILECDDGSDEDQCRADTALGLSRAESTSQHTTKTLKQPQLKTGKKRGGGA
ncbi:basement membrane-specific heparan sulfate proteoglycan core protein, partial [Elysia marginata]